MSVPMCQHCGSTFWYLDYDDTLCALCNRPILTRTTATVKLVRASQISGRRGPQRKAS